MKTIGISRDDQELFGEQNPRCFICRRPGWGFSLLRLSDVVLFRVFHHDLPGDVFAWLLDATFKVWYSALDSFFDTCVWVQIKRGKIIP